MPALIMMKRYPLLSRVLVWIIGPVLLSLAAIYLWLHGGLPEERGSETVSGISSQVRILRDAHSVPSIQAKNESDAYFALGFLHAQDRLWQMEMNRRTAAGRLSEIVGERGLFSDTAMRQIGLYRQAQTAWDALDKQSREILISYSAGINAAMRSMSPLPVEFQLFHHSPEQWKPTDSLALIQLLAWQMSGNIAQEVDRLALIQHQGLQVANTLLAPTSADAIHRVESATVIGNLSSAWNQALRMQSDTKHFVGSNSWVIAGKYTATGYPILANDPHLANSIPSIWYLANIHGGQLQVSGATIPGLPFVVIGKNQSIAWGMTNTSADTEDLMLERINPLNPNQYEMDGRYQDMELAYDAIKVRGKFLMDRERMAKIKVRRTRHGTVISDDILPSASYAVSLRWTGALDKGGTFQSFVNLNYAHNWKEFNAALSTFVAPMHNFIYADRDGNIGSVTPGALPIRGLGDGSIPTPGWRQAADWTGFVPFDRLPRTFNPDQGMIVNANHKFVAPDYPYHVATDWAPDYRANRITESLRALIQVKNKKITPDDLKKLQSDVVSPLIHVQLWSVLQHLPPHTAAQKAALQELQHWQGAMDQDSVAATIATVWSRHLIHMLVKHKQDAKVAGVDYTLDKFAHIDNLPFLDAVISQKTSWCSTSSSQGSGCDAILYQSLDAALDELTSQFGSRIDDWKWGRLHKKMLAHFPFSNPAYMPSVPLTNADWTFSLFDRDAPAGGGDYTVNVGSISFSPDADVRYLQLFGPSYRQVVDVSSPETAWFVLDAGQSGNPVSKHYDDLMPIHQHGQYLQMDAADAQSAFVLIPRKTR